MFNSTCSKFRSRPVSNTDVALCLYAADARIEDDADKMQLIDVVQDVDNELGNDHDVLLYFFPSQFQIHDDVETEDDQADDLEGEDDLENDDDVERDDVE